VKAEGSNRSKAMEMRGCNTIIVIIKPLGMN
jgi:hypothetical protein